MQPASNLTHKATAAASGATGGLFGLPALAIELPISTIIILRSITDIAQNEGENLDSIDAQLACLEGFALGGTTSSDDDAESGYCAIRITLAGTVANAAQSLASQGLGAQSAPPLMRLIADIAARFSIPITQKSAAQAVPTISAACGALVNTLFINHFQDIARGHFVVRCLDQIYGPELVRARFAELA
jgi:hypothetical protein